MDVWIKGSNFHDKVVVKFGDRLAKIVESNPNLVIAQVPARPGLTKDLEVEVEFANKYGTELVVAEAKLTYKYRIGLRPKEPTTALSTSITSNVSTHPPTQVPTQGRRDSSGGTEKSYTASFGELSLSKRKV